MMKQIPNNMDTGQISDGYHTFNELYQFRLLYNAAFFNLLALQKDVDVYKARKHYDGNFPFNNPNYFIVVAELPTGQISNHYPMKGWTLFKIKEKEYSNPYDNHTTNDVINRITNYLINMKDYDIR